MKAISTIVLSTAITLLFLGNIGVDVFKHFCDEDGVSVAYVFNTIDHCDSHEEELPPCCEEEQEDDCCDDEVEHFQLKLDYFQAFDKVQFCVFPSINLNSFVLIEPTLDKKIISFCSNTDPPPKKQSERLAKIQTYLI